MYNEMSAGQLKADGGGKAESTVRAKVVGVSVEFSHNLCHEEEEAWA